MNVIIGAGISGLSAGQALQGDFMILEKGSAPGGLSGQYRAGGFAFDHGGHYFHFQDKPEIRRHVEAFRAFRRFQRNSKVFLQGRFIPYSLQYHLAGLPARLRRPILAEILAGAGGPPKQDLEKFLLAHFGPSLVRLFFAPYLEKFYQRPLAAMIAGMDKGSIPVPRKKDVLAGARRQRPCAEGYNPVFYYPSGSLQAFIDDYARPLEKRIRCQEEVIAIEAGRKRVITRTGSYRYDCLVSTMPLKQLLGIMTPPPPFPRQRLRHLSTLVVNAVLARRRRRFHWLYLPEKRFPFYRVGYYPAAGTVAVYLEKTMAADSALDARQVRNEALLTLRQTGMIAGSEELLFLDLKRIPVSYVVFDRDWPRLVPAILAQLRRQDIHSIGRYGSWNYTSMTDDILLARETALRLNGA
jgi:protoporphyrinogen oxidase